MNPKAPTIIALALIAFLVAVVGGYMAFTKYSRRSNQMRESSKIRGIHQNLKLSAAELTALTQPSNLQPATQPTTKPAIQPATAPSSSAVRSVWSTSSGNAADWKSQILNGENNRLGTLSLNTKYGSTINSNDSIFPTTQPATQPTSTLPANPSAMFGDTSENH